MKNQNVVVKLVTRPEIKGKRKWVPVNPKLQYSDDTTFILRWLPSGTSTYRTKTLGRWGLKRAMVECALFGPPIEETPETPVTAVTLEEMRTAFLLDKRTTLKKDGTPLDAGTILSYELVTTEFLGIRGDSANLLHPAFILGGKQIS